MNIKRIFFWISFLVVLALILWGLVVAMNKAPKGDGVNLGAPAVVTAEDHIIGPAEAPVTIIEYSDFECPACQMYYYVLERLVGSSTVPVRLVYRHFPLLQHKNAIPASLASEAAARQGKFWEMYRLIFENASDWVELGDATSIFQGYARDIGLDLAIYEKDLTDPALLARVKRDLNEGTAIGINATPTFFLNGKVIANPTSYDEFQTIIQAAASDGSN